MTAMTRTSTDRRVAMAAKRACARDVMAQMVVHHPALGEWCTRCREATGDQVVALSQTIDGVVAQARALAEQIVIGTMPIQWRGEERDAWIAALSSEATAAAMAMRFACTSEGRADPAHALEVVDRRRADFAAWQGRLEASLQAIDKHSSVMGHLVRLAVDEIIGR